MPKRAVTVGYPFIHDSQPLFCHNGRTMSQRILLCLLALVSARPLTNAQIVPVPPPAILEIYRDPVKPGKLPEYARVESEAALVCARANTWPYLAAQSISGPQTEVWYMEGFDSYASVERSGDPFIRNAALSGELNRLMEAKTNLVGDARVIFAHYREDLSSTLGLMPPRTRFLTVTLVTTRPGHEREFEEIHRTLRSVRQSAKAGDNRLVYQIVSGMPKNIYLIFSAYHTLQTAGNGLDPAADDYTNDVDEATRGRLDEYTRVSVVSSETWVFSVNPAISNPAGEWIIEDPEFWKSSPGLQRQAGPRKPAADNAARQPPTHN